MTKLIHHGTGPRPSAAPLPTEPLIVTEAEIHEAMGAHVSSYPNTGAVIREIMYANAAFAEVGEAFGTQDGERVHAFTGLAAFNRHVYGLLSQLGLRPVVQQA